MTTEREPCFACAEPVAPDAQICPHCHVSALVSVALDAPVADQRVRYRLARSLAALGPPMRPFLAMQSALGSPRPLLAQGVTRGFAAKLTTLLSGDNIPVRLSPAEPLPAKPAARPTIGTAGRVAAVVIAGCLMILGFLGYWTWRRLRPANSDPATTSSTTGETAASPTALTTSQIAEVSMRSTVSLRCKDSVATGFFVAGNAILTNAHALCQTEPEIDVVLSDGRHLTGTPLSSNADLDLAVIKVQGALFAPLPLGDVATVKVGDRVVFIGSPVGLEFTVHEGSISTVSRPIYGLSFIQLDAKINPGNSGGPLLDSQGRVIGIVSLKHKSAEGIGMALPINYAYTGENAMIAPPPGQILSQRFNDMMAQAKASSEADRPLVASTPTVILPLLVAASVNQYGYLVARLALPSSYPPGFREITVNIWSDTEMICTLKGDVKEWQPIERVGPMLALDRNQITLLQERSVLGQLYLGEAVLRWDLCPREKMRPGIIMELQDADPASKRLRLH